MSSSKKKKLFKTLFTVSAGCGGGGCGRPKLSDAYQPKPKPKSYSCSKPQIPRDNHENDDVTSTTSFSLKNVDSISSSDSTFTESELSSDPPRVKISGQVCPKIVNSIAVVKDSDDPFQDFRHSMLQMIVEKRIYSKHDLEELLRCFLELNSRCHHHVILKAFMEIRNQMEEDRKEEVPSFVHVHGGGGGGGEKPPGSY